MGKITSGGLIGFDEPKRMARSMGTQETQREPEDWGQYAVRNVAKIPALAYQLGRSGLGLGNLLQGIGVGEQSGAQNPADALRSMPAPVADAIRRALIPSTQEANQEISQVLPKYATESRPEDFWPEFALTTLPLMGRNAFSSLPAFGKGALHSLGILGGAEVGKSAGGEIGDLLGNRRLGEVVGGLGGGYAGGKLAGVAANRPSSLVGKIQEKQQGQFEQGKVSRLAQAEQEYGPKLAQLEKDRIKATLAVPKEKSAFDSAKKDSVNALKTDITNYKKNIEKLDKARSVNYKKATELESGKIGKTDKLMKSLKDVSENIEHGVDMADKKLLTDNIGQLWYKAQKGELPLSIGKQFQKNFNDQIYNYNMSRNFKKYMGEVTNSLNEFIEETGGPEHSKYWKQAEQETRNLKQLQRGQRDFIKEKNEVIRDVSKEKFSPEKEVALKNDIREANNLLKGTQKELDDIKKTIGKESFEDILKSQQKTNKLTEFISEQIGAGATDKASKYGLAGLMSIAGYIFGGRKGAFAAGLVTQGGKALLNEIKTVREVMKNHPEIYKDYTTLLKEYETLPKATILRHLNDIGQKIEEEIPEERTSKKGKITKGGLL